MDDDAVWDIGPRKITARVAPFLDAIEAARKDGWSWADIALRVSPGASGDAVRIAVRECRYKGVEQRALPVLAAAPPAAGKNVIRRSDTGSDETASSDRSNKSPAGRYGAVVGGKTEEEVAVLFERKS
ncbi:hypothetical protein HAP94_07975 [Acidithiobacillus ferrivorans]|nr:hypothetical protein [Acidithiobacillus ferrivorans]